MDPLSIAAGIVAFTAAARALTGSMKQFAVRFRDAREQMIALSAELKVVLVLVELLKKAESIPEDTLRSTLNGCREVLLDLDDTLCNYSDNYGQWAIIGWREAQEHCEKLHKFENQLHSLSHAVSLQVNAKIKRNTESIKRTVTSTSEDIKVLKRRISRLEGKVDIGLDTYLSHSALYERQLGLLLEIKQNTSRQPDDRLRQKEHISIEEQTQPDASGTRDVGGVIKDTPEISRLPVTPTRTLTPASTEVKPFRQTRTSERPPTPPRTPTPESKAGRPPASNSVLQSGLKVNVQCKYLGSLNPASSLILFSAAGACGDEIMTTTHRSHDGTLLVRTYNEAFSVLESLQPLASFCDPKQLSQIQISFSPLDQMKCLISLEGGHSEVWDLSRSEDKKLSYNLPEASAGPLYFLARNSSEHIAFLAPDREELHVWDLSAESIICTIRASKDAKIKSYVSFSNHQYVLIVESVADGSSAGKEHFLLAVHDTTSGERIAAANVQDDICFLRPLQASIGGRYQGTLDAWLYAQFKSTKNHGILRWNITNNTLDVNATPGGTKCLSVSPDGYTLVSNGKHLASNRSEMLDLLFFDPSEKDGPTEISIVPYTRGKIKSASLLADGQRLAIVKTDVVEIWDLLVENVSTLPTMVG